MGYEYKDEILEDIGPEPNANFDIESERYYQKLEELDEVYRKAKAFDEIREYSEDQMAYDLGDSYVLSNVSYAIQKAVDETEGE